MSLGQDAFKTEIVGNLTSDPVLVEDDSGSGNKVCYCKVATNPMAQKYDLRTGRELTPEERNKRRSFVELKITKTAAAEKFAEMFRKGDRAQLKGQCGTRRVEKAFWSEKDEKYLTVQVDVDNDGKNIQNIWEDRIMMWVDEFARVEIDSGHNTLVHS